MTALDSLYIVLSCEFNVLQPNL